MPNIRRIVKRQKSANHLLISLIYKGKTFGKSFAFKDLKKDQKKILRFYKLMGFALRMKINDLIEQGGGL
jgi:hypothetical protein